MDIRPCLAAVLALVLGAACAHGGTAPAEADAQALRDDPANQRL
jgi:hypothetical protein